MKKKTLIIVIAATAVSLLGLALIYMLVRRGGGGSGYLPVYFYNASLSRLEAESHGFVSSSQEQMLTEAVNGIFGQPHTATLTRPWPGADGFLESYKMNGNILEAYFTEMYGELPPVDESLFRTAFVLTMTELPFVDHVQIIPAGAENVNLTYLNGTNHDNNPTISPARIIARTFNLYFVNADATGLVMRVHSSTEVDMDQKEYYIIQQLIAGQNDEGVFPAIPNETRVSVEMDDSTSTCHVNFSSDIQRFNGNQELATLMLYSIVNSLTELINVKRVQFQIDSERVDQFKGVTGFDQVFERNEAYIPE